MKHLKNILFLMSWLTVSAVAQAQLPMAMNNYMMTQPQYGTGQLMGAPPCGYEPKVAKQVQEVQDEIDDIEKDKEEAEELLEDLQDKLEEYEEAIQDSVHEDDVSTILNIVQNEFWCDKDAAQHTEERKAVTNTHCKVQKTGGRMIDAATACSGVSSKNGRPAPRSRSQGLCRKALGLKGEVYEYYVVSERIKELERSIEWYDNKLDRLDNKKRRVENRVARDVREGRDDRSRTTEGGCPNGNCGRQGPGWKEVIFGTAVDILGIGLNYMGQKHAINRAADLGAVYPYPGIVNPFMPPIMPGMGYPFFGGGIYGGAYGGLGAGGFGCAPTIGGGGFPGGPFGMAGPFGGWNPYGGNGGIFGYPPWMMGGMPGMPGMGGPFGNMIGFGGIGIVGGMMGGMPGMMGMMGGYPMMGGMPGMMGGMPGMMGGMPGMMGGMPGMMGGMPGMMGGMPGMMGGMPGMMGGMPGMMGGMPGMMGGMPGMAGMMGMGGMMGLDQQMRQMQAYMEFIRIQQETMLPKMQNMFMLYYEYAELMRKMQQAQQALGGMYGGAVGIGFGGGGYLGSPLGGR